MGKVKDWVIGMQEDATWMSRDSWAGKHGSYNLDVFDRTQREMDEGNIVEPDGPIVCRPFSGEDGDG